MFSTGMQRNGIGTEIQIPCGSDNYSTKIPPAAVQTHATLFSLPFSCVFVFLFCVLVNDTFIMALHIIIINECSTFPSQ